MRPAILALAFGAACLDASAQILVFDSGTWANIQVAAQDGNGGIYAAGLGEPFRLWRWNENWQPSYGQPWNGWGSSDTANANPAALEPMGNGLLVSLWERPADHTVQIVILSQNSMLPSLSPLQGPAQLTRCCLNSRTNLWVAEAGLNICTALRALNRMRQKPQLVHTITLDELWPGGDATNRLPVSMVEDGRGRIWFWSNCLLGSDERGAVRGVLIGDGDAVVHRPGLSGVATNRISVIVPLDKTNVWIAVRDAGIFMLNLETLAGVPVPVARDERFSRRPKHVFSGRRPLHHQRWRGRV